LFGRREDVKNERENDKSERETGRRYPREYAASIAGTM